MVPIGPRAIGWVRRYQDEIRPSLVVPPDEGIMFLTTMGESITPNRSTALVRGYIRAADLGKSGSCHLFRHTCATLMLEGGADIRYIQEMLGHAELSTTRIYTQVSIRKLQQVHAATHPAAAVEGDEGSGVDDDPETPTVDDLLDDLELDAEEERGDS